MEIVWNFFKPILNSVVSKLFKKDSSTQKIPAKDSRLSVRVGTVTLLPVTVGNVYTGGLFLSAVVLGAFLTALLALIIVYVENKSLVSVIFVLAGSLLAVTYLFLKPRSMSLPTANLTSASSASGDTTSVTSSPVVTNEVSKTNRNHCELLVTSAIASNEDHAVNLNLKWKISKWQTQIKKSGNISKSVTLGKHGSVELNVLKKDKSLLLNLKTRIPSNSRFIDIEIVSSAKEVNWLRCRRFLVPVEEQQKEWLNSGLEIPVYLLMNFANLQLNCLLVLRNNSLSNVYSLSATFPRQFEVMWRIRDVGNRNWSPGEKLFSPIFVPHDYKTLFWILQVCPNGRDKSFENDIGLFISLFGKPKHVTSVAISFKVVLEIGEQRSEHEGEYRFVKCGGCGVLNNMGNLIDVKPNQELLIKWIVKYSCHSQTKFDSTDTNTIG